jgi:signal transduction histidine kinase
MNDSQKSKFPGLYLSALRRHLKPSLAPTHGAAGTLGLRAVKLGLEILELAEIHQESLIALALPSHSRTLSDGMIRKAGVFFTEVLAPIEETHRSAVEANIELKETVKTLSQRTAELAASNEGLKREIVHRLAVEESLRTSEATTSKLLEQSRQMQEELRQLSRRLLTVQEEERKRISRELHDVIGETLTGVNVRLATLNSQSASGIENIRKKIAVTQRLVGKSMGIIHRFACDLRPTVLDQMGLIPSLVAHLRVFSKRTHIPVEFTACAGVEKLDAAVRTAIYRIAQEALANIARHAGATRTSVSILKNGRLVCMEITDNGAGFDVTSAGLGRKVACLGLLGMRERVEMIGGTFCAESEAGVKTTIRVLIPHHSSIPQKHPASISSAKTSPSCP